MVVNDHLNHWLGEEISIFAFEKSVDEIVANFSILVYMRNVEERKRHRLLRIIQTILLTRILTAGGWCHLEHFFCYFTLSAPERGLDNTILDPTVCSYCTRKHPGLSLVIEAVIYHFQALSEIFLGTYLTKFDHFQKSVDNEG